MASERRRQGVGESGPGVGPAGVLCCHREMDCTEIDTTPVRSLIDRIIQRWSPRQIWLFGSRARGEATDASDWDLLVVLDDRTLDAELDPRVAWQLGRNVGVRADVIACRAGEFQEARNTPNTLAYDAAHEGGLLYER